MNETQYTATQSSHVEKAKLETTWRALRSRRQINKSINIAGADYVWEKSHTKILAKSNKTRRSKQNKTKKKQNGKHGRPIIIPFGTKTKTNLASG